jgi:hypothetical protein
MRMLVDPYCLIFLLFFMFYCEMYFNVFHVLNIGLVNSFIFPQRHMYVLLRQAFFYWDIILKSSGNIYNI